MNKVNVVMVSVYGQVNSTPSPLPEIILGQAAKLVAKHYMPHYSDIMRFTTYLTYINFDDFLKMA